MSHAVVLYFDSEIENRLRQLAETLVQQGISPAQGEQPARPHIALAGYDQPLLAPALVRLEACARDLPPLDVRLLALGWFPTQEGIIYLAPAVTLEMLILHAAFHRLMGAEGVISHASYRPRVWVPYCAVAVGAPLTKIPILTEVCQSLGIFAPGRLSTLGVLDLPSAHEVMSVPLAG
jgi:hypothetical protein